MIETLLGIPDNSEVYPAARRRAAQALYQRFRASGGAQQQVYARRYLDVALRMMTFEMERIGTADSLTSAELVKHCRMLLEIALTNGVMRRPAARQGFVWLEELASSHDADLEPFRDELEYRRMQEHLHAGELSEAGALADALWQRDEAMIWSRLCSRALFNHGHRLWREAGSDDDIELTTLQLVDRYGGRILLETAGEPDALKRQAVLGYHATVANAARLIYERTHDERRGRAALTLYERLLRERSDNALFLRATARLSEQFEKSQQALDCWRKLLAGSVVRSESWFEAKFHQIQMLIELGLRDRASAVLLQHLQLNPDYGPDPWGARLKGLEQQLAGTADSDRDAGEEGTP
jgi:tetratricopeptide (TPR) repeat protein